MAIYYLDTSALVKYYVTEPGSVWIRQLIDDQDNVLVSAEITITEVSAALAVINRTGHISQRQRDELWGKFKRDLLMCYELLPTHRTVVNRAAELCQQYPLRGFDAIHLASGLFLQETLTQQDKDVITTYVTGDHSLITLPRQKDLKRIIPSGTPIWIPSCPLDLPDVDEDLYRKTRKIVRAGRSADDEQPCLW